MSKVITSLPDHYDAITTHTSLECVVDGERLTGYLVDDGERWWVWARSAVDARAIAAMSAVGRPELDVPWEEASMAYLKATGMRMGDAWVTALTEEVLAEVKFQDEDGTTRPMADEMKLRARRGCVASSLY